MDLTTNYLGIPLKNPLVPSASPLSKNTDTARELEDAGAAALVMYSLFEEQIEMEEEQMMRFLHHEEMGSGEAQSFHPTPSSYSSSQEQYLKQIQSLKQALEIPVIASLNGTTLGGWTDYAREIESAGADALEINAYIIAANTESSGTEVEDQYVELLRTLKSAVSIPVTMKLSPYFSCLASFVKRLSENGADGVSLFNRFYQPDINLDNMKLNPNLELSHPSEALLRMHWVAILHGRVNLSLAATGGVHSAEDAIKLLLCGANVIHLCSTLLKNGPRQLLRIRDDIRRWMNINHYESVEQLCGSFSHKNVADPSAYERHNYLQLIDSFSTSQGVWR